MARSLIATRDVKIAPMTLRTLRVPAFLVLLLLTAALPGVSQAAAPAGISCKAYLLYDLTTEQTVDVFHPELRQPIASLTKLMTAILAEEKLRFDGRYVLTPEESKIFATETMRADKMLEMMLVCSNNKMCTVVSRIIAGSETGFADLMNMKARQLGLVDTRFVNASGLPGSGQYSTLHDLLLLTRIALSYPRVREVMQRGYVELGGKQYEGTLLPLYKRHPGLQGGKTGYTKAAGRCLVLVYRSGGHEYALITMGSSGVKASFRDAETLLKHYGLYEGPIGEWK
jgi:D-alanyl-D-alanine carboxypeptidase